MEEAPRDKVAGTGALDRCTGFMITIIIRNQQAATPEIAMSGRASERPYTPEAHLTPALSPRRAERE
jgi:hypothetical protein